MQTKSGTFEVGTVNETKVNKKFDFEYRVFDTWAEVLSSADWSEKNLLEQVNSYEKASAKANKYQEVTKEYRPDTSTPEFKRESLINNLVKTFGVPRAIAEQQIDQLIAASKAEPEKVEEPAEPANV